ncbi:tripartite tricarboxylate transporter substrate binding protein [Allopusillimonas ginsengisoli]|uniref:tripartite tricarboxylate transporter substrate binding protein n=1 Tax=Allopusillimonas ginsengisoli TaxID=453575 RepID=UPI0010215CEE|nr:tripartite tricarboxylate transporter substrate binding protein [Allopusillimonas ginsengisoli]TEA78889.1 tripartite tricarboxylate transporter substrate binding protein [Allopusillimonas ginsengisoli]
MAYLKHGIFLLLFAVMSTAVAQSRTAFPSKPIELVIPYPPGGPNDVIGRMLGEQMAKTLGQSVVVRNLPGAGGNVATASVSRAKPDGYTLLLPAMAYAVNPSIFKDVNYQFEDFQPISMIVRGPLVLVAHPSLGFRTVDDLIAAAKAQPGKLEYASGGVGTSLHLAGELFKSTANIDLLHVPYKGTGELMPDLLAGRVSALFSSPLTVLQQIKQGKLIALGTTGDKPMDEWGGLRPISETVPGYEMFGWYSLMAPAGVPREVVQTLNAAVQAAQRSPDFLEKMATLGMETVETSPEEAETYINAEIAKWASVVEQARISAN